MRIEIFELTLGGILDLERKVADIRVDGGGEIRIFCHDPRRERLLNDLFLNDAERFVAVGEPGGDVHADAVEVLPKGTREAIEQLLEDELYGFNLGGRIVS